MAGDDESTVILKPMGRVIRSPKQRVAVAPQHGPRSNENCLKKEMKAIYRFLIVCHFSRFTKLSL